MSKIYKPVKSAKAMAKLADAWFAARDFRLAKKRELEELESNERAAKQALIQSLINTGTTAIGGATVTVTFQSKLKPTVENWDLLWKHIKKTGEFDLLQKRVGEAAVQLRWDEDISIPGVGSYVMDDITYSRKPA